MKRAALAFRTILRGGQSIPSMPVICVVLAGIVLCRCWKTICEPETWPLLHCLGLYGSIAGVLGEETAVSPLGVRGLRALDVEGLYCRCPAADRWDPGTGVEAGEDGVPWTLRKDVAIEGRYATPGRAR